MFKFLKNMSVLCLKWGCNKILNLGWAFSQSPPSATVAYLTGGSGPAAGTK